MTRLGDWANRDLAQVRYFVDEDLSALGRALMGLRHDVVVSKTPPIVDLISHDDEAWIPEVTERGWVAITNDKHIRTRPWEAPVAVERGLKCVHLDAGRDARPWDFMRLLAHHWDHVEHLRDREGPMWLALRVGRSPHERPYRPGAPPRLPRGG